MKLAPSVPSLAIYLATTLWFVLPSFGPTGTQALRPTHKVNSLNTVPASTNSSQPKLPDWIPTGQSQHQGNTAPRNMPDFGDTGQPDSHAGGASRNGLNTCPTTEVPLTVVAPVDAGYGGHTTQATPTLWVYVPFTLDASNPITVSLVDNEQTPLYEAFQAVEHEPGILKLTLPDEVVLEPEQVYRWFFIVNCNDPLGIQNALMVEGWIKRVENSFDSDPFEMDEDHALSTEQRIAWSHQYAGNLVWYDALMLLGDGLLENPDDPQIRQAWSELLGYPSVQLESLDAVPLSDCCIPDASQGALIE